MTMIRMIPFGKESHAKKQKMENKDFIVIRLFIIMEYFIFIRSKP